MYIPWNLKTLSYSDKKCHNISKDTIWYHKLSKSYLNVFLTNIFCKHSFQKIIAILWKWTTECFKLITDIICGYNLIFHGSLNVPIEHHPTIRYMDYNGYYKVMSNIPKMEQLPTPVFRHILTNTCLKKSLFFLQYLENEPLNVLKLIVDIIYG